MQDVFLVALARWPSATAASTARTAVATPSPAKAPKDTLFTFQLQARDPAALSHVQPGDIPLL
jgi:hypothetical protein